MWNPETTQNSHKNLILLCWLNACQILLSQFYAEEKSEKFMEGW